MKEPSVRLTKPTTISSKRLALGVWLVAACAHAAPVPGISPGESKAPHQKGVSVISGENDGHTDPIPDPAAGSDVSLGGMLAYADAHSPVLSVARSTRSRADAARVGASILLPNNPQLTVAAGPRLTNGGNGLDFQASLSQQIQIAGERGTRKAAAERFAEMTDAEIEQVRWTVHCDVHAAFHRTLVEQERAKLAERVVAFQKEVLGVVERQIKAGETAPLSLRLAQAEVAQAEQQSVAAKQSLLASRIRLAQLSGWPVGTPPNPTGVVDSPRAPPSLEELHTAAESHLPLLRTGQTRIREAEARVAMENRSAWPQPSIGIQYSRESSPGTPNGQNDIVLGVLSIPIPSFSRNQGPRAQAQADATVAQAELQAAKKLLDGQIAEARSEVDAAAQRTSAYGTEILPRFGDNLKLLKRSFELGEIDILALSTGRERFMRIQSDALTAQQDYFVALAGLERVVGVDLWHDDHHADESPAPKATEGTKP